MKAAPAPGRVDFNFKTKNSDRWNGQLTPAGLVGVAERPGSSRARINPEPNSPGESYAAFERLLTAACLVQAKLLFLPTVAVGGSAAVALTALAEAAHDEPANLDDVDLRQWRLLKAEYQDLNRVRSVCGQFALKVSRRQATQP